MEGIPLVQRRILLFGYLFLSRIFTHNYCLGFRVLGLGFRVISEFQSTLKLQTFNLNQPTYIWALFGATSVQDSTIPGSVNPKPTS